MNPKRPSPQRQSPPRWADRLLAWFVAPHLLEYVQGDLHEAFHRRVAQGGLARARREYGWAVLHCLTPFFYKQKPTVPLQHSTGYDNAYQPLSNLHPAMLRNYLKIAWRNLIRHKTFAFINITGLALGIACMLLIGLWVYEEYSYDRFLPNAQQIYALHYNLERNGEVVTTLSTPGPLQQAIQHDIPQVAHVTKIADWPNLLVRNANLTAGQQPAKERGYYATDAFFDIFDFPTLAGNPKMALANPSQIVISHKMALKYFPRQDALGKQLQLNNDKYYTVGAVLADLPTTSTLQFDWVANFKAFEQDWMKAWGDNPFQTYVRLTPQTTPTQAEAAMKGLYARYTDWKSAKEGRIYPILQPLTEQHLYSVYQNGKPAGGRIAYVRIFSLVALFILLVACINFMTLATARSALRTKEISVRKVVGARRSALMAQFLSESTLMGLLASLLALGIVGLALPTFNTTFDTQLTLNLSEPGFWGGLVGLVLLTGLLAGSYPALFLSGLSPLRMLKGNGLATRLSVGTSRVALRQALVVFQFALAVFLLVGMLTVGRQLRYLYGKNLGLDRENVVAIPLEGELLKPGRPEPFRQQLLRLPMVASAVSVNKLPVNITSGSGDLIWPGKDPDKPVTVSGDFVGPDYAKTMQIHVLAGHEFRANNRIDSGGYLINESAAKLMGMRDPVGREIEFWRGKGPIVGLIQDFHLQSLHQPITPLILAFDEGNASYVLVKIRAGQTEQALAGLERVARQLNPNYPFSYRFLDDVYGNLYRSEQQIRQLINTFGLLALAISSLGLFGLVAFMAERRTKEIGIRKVLGASVPSILSLLSKDFLKLVLVAIIIAAPLAGFALNRWLKGFAYKIDLAWWEFALAGLLVIGIALLTISYQAIKAALMNPVKSLRSE